MDTPYFICDESELIRNLSVIDYIQKTAGCKVLFATKSFALDSILKIIYKYVDGVVTSGEYEAKHAFDLLSKDKYIASYSPAFSDRDFDDFVEYSTHIVFNSMSQVHQYRDRVRSKRVGLRINPEVSGMRTPRHYGGLSDYSRKESRLGVRRKYLSKEFIIDFNIEGLLLHFNFENDSFDLFLLLLEKCEEVCQDLLKLPSIKWVSLGGGISYTFKNYPVDAFCETIQDFGKKYEVEVLLEPGHAIISSPFHLVASVIDIIENEMPIAILDTSAEAHLPEALLNPSQWTIIEALSQLETEKEEYNQYGKYEYIISGLTCLLGDIFGKYKFKEPLNIGQRLVFINTGDYSIVKNTFFNGIKKPNVYIKKIDGNIELIREYSYSDYLVHVS
jgi:carboxynorspermidine decarboxylase